jgi:acetyltransferase-like isoleucine patch superfamily enzyme
MAKPVSEAPEALLGSGFGTVYANRVAVASDVELGPDASIDPGVLLGYPPGRPGVSGPTRIGARARLRAGSIVYAAVDIGDDFETGHHAVVREETRIGSHCTLWNHSTIDYGCRLGDRVRIHCNVYVSQFTTLEDDVFLAPGVTIGNDPHPICTKCMQGPTIRRGARIGLNVTLLPLITIGENALVGAGSVVTIDVPAGMVVAGNPAQIVGPVDSLECPFGIVNPYVAGVDVRRRPEWDTVPALTRPIVRPRKSSD